MKVLIRLGNADRERLDAPESFVVDINKVSMTEAIILQAGRKIDEILIAYESPSHWRKALGEGAMGGLLVMVWLGLRQNGLKLPFNEFEFDIDGMNYDIVPDPNEPDEEAGKATSGPETTS